MSFERAFGEAKAQPDNPIAVEQLAQAALDHAEEERALPLLAAACSKPSPRLLQWKALLERALDRHEEALSSFRRASALAPGDAGIAHGLARTALEAGLPAEQLYERALALAPANGEVLAGLAAARVSSGHGERAEQALAAIVAKNPGWIDGQMQLAQLRSVLGKSANVVQSLDDALNRTPHNTGLWAALFDLHIKREAFTELAAALRRASGQGMAEALLTPYAAIAAAELGRTDEADRHFARWTDPAGNIWRIRHLLRSGRPDKALPVIDAGLAGERVNEIWPYASIAWRLAGDVRHQWLLQESDRQVQIIDLTPDLPPLDKLAATLREIHVCKDRYLDQSVRGGTQTDGPLFSRIDPEIRALRSAVVGAVQRYIAGLPDSVTGHPLLGRRRDRPLRFAGSWSVRLRGAGHHVSHVHPEGWISSALHIVLPPPDRSSAGCLALGKPPPGLAPSGFEARYVEPKQGRLVLFPSWLWHETVPFQQGERLSVAFDVAPPR